MPHESVGRFVSLEFGVQAHSGGRYFVNVARPEHKNLAVGAKQLTQSNLQQIPRLRRVPCDLWCDLAVCFWHFWYFEDFVSCITYVFSVSCESSSPPLRTTKCLLVSLVYGPHFFV